MARRAPERVVDKWLEAVPPPVAGAAADVALPLKKRVRPDADEAARRRSGSVSPLPAK